MSTVRSIPSTSLPQNRKCKECTEIVELPASRCTKCRARRQEKRRQSTKQRATHVMENIDVNSQGVTETKKRKANTASVEDDRKRKKRKLQNFVKKMPVLQPVPNSENHSADSSETDRPEQFMNASEMHRRLKKLASSWTPGKTFRFNAYFSVIVDSKNPDNEKQSKLFARDISKIAGLPFNHNSYSKVAHKRDGDRFSLHTLTFPCNCVNDTTPKNSQSSLATWLSSQTSKEKSSECDGFIEIGSADDESHPLEIPAFITISFESTSATHHFIKMSSADNVARGLKAAINNPRVSDEAKESAQERLNDMTGTTQEHENRVLGGYKATLSNPSTSESAKDHAREVLDAAGVADYTGSTEAEFNEHDTRVLAGYKAALSNPRVSAEAKLHAEEYLRERGAV
uniref:Uncharacterized protein n=1 Tax=Moniliophthora roreri TaxID=221103 RepID=A0A0W0G332_MONRR